jgi:pimeloyl-ACP methyl ester carboxylesterase
MTHRIRRSTAALCLATAVAAMPHNSAGAQATPDSSYESRFVQVPGARLQYFDFGGNGIPILFTAGARPADTWLAFAPRFTDHHRVLALTDRWVPPSEGEGNGYVVRAQDMLAFLDSLGIERAVVAGNAQPAPILLYLAEHHPERIAGLIFLAPASEAGFESMTDPSRAMQMVGRAFLSVEGRDPEQAGSPDEDYFYRPRYLSEQGRRITIPAITFVNRDGTRGLEDTYYPLQIARMVAGGLTIPDSVSRTYFERLATDSSLQREVRAAWDTVFAPVISANEQVFFRAFGEHLRIVRIDVPEVDGIPFLTGYEFRDAPELIEGHIRDFLAEIRAREWAR